jgi:CubicO group peptidase (beta-lactamase class C family)
MIKKSIFGALAIILSCIVILFFLRIISMHRVSHCFDLKNVKDIIQKYEQEKLLSGTILIAQKGKIIFLESYGFANIDKKIKNTNNNKFLIASLTKEFTAAAILLLADRKLINIHEKISTYLKPDAAIWGGKMPAWANEITIHQLLSHGAGLPSYISLPGFDEFYEKPQSTAQLIQFIAQAELIFKPGTSYKYTGTSYNILGAIIETVSSKSYGNFLKENFFEPLGLKNIYAPHDAILRQVMQEDPQLSVGYRLNEQTHQLEAVDDVNFSTAFAEASIISTAADLFYWLYALAKGRLISEDALAKMVSSYFSPDEETGIGYGITIETIKEQKIWVHTGMINGYASINLYAPHQEIAVIILSNVMVSNIFKLGYDLLEALY